MGAEKRADCDSMSRLEVRPIGLKAANRFVEVNHRHHKKVAGCKFSICACKGDVIVGVAKNLRTTTKGDEGRNETGLYMFTVQSSRRGDVAA